MIHVVECVLPEQLGDECCIADRTFHELNAVGHVATISTGEIIETDNMKALLPTALGDVRPDEAGRTCDKHYRHCRRPIGVYRSERDGCGGRVMIVEKPPHE